MNKRKWKQFKLCDLFIYEKSKGYKVGQLINGDIPYIARVAVNNGVSRTAGNQEKHYPANTITIHHEWKDTWVSFYQPKEYITDGMIGILKPKFNLTENIGLFISCLINKQPAFGPVSNAINISISLPIDSFGLPDWKFMEESVRQLEESVRQQLCKAIPKLREIDTSNWKEFKVGDVLQRVKIKSISKISNKFEKGEIRVIGNSSINNGVIDFLNIPDEESQYIHSGNVLSYGAKGGNFFYQKDKWASTDHVHMFQNKKINEYNQLFICTILNKIIDAKGGWRSSLESNVVNEKILLPVNSTGEPDWKFMEEYMKLTNKK